MQHDPFTHSDDQPGDQLKQPQIVCAGDCDAEPVEWLWPEKIPIGKVTLLIGDPGTGKSLVALDIAARASRLAPWPDANIAAPMSIGDSSPHSSFDIRHSSPSPFGPQPASVILLSATDDLADTIRPRLDAAGADPHRIFVVPSLADLRDDFDQLRAAVDRAPNCRLIIIDPINAYVGPSDSHFQTVVRKVLEPLAKLAAKRRIAVLAVAHLRKSDGAAIHRAAGSMGFVASARAVWTVCRDQNNPGQFLMLPIKNNLAPAACGLAYSIEAAGPHSVAAISWHSAPISTSAEEALHSPEATDLNRARQWLRTSLSHGPRSASKVTEEAAHYGFQPRTLRRALHAIGGTTQNRGLLEGWWWSLPDDTNVSHQSAPGSAGGLPHCEVALPISNDADPNENTLSAPPANPSFTPTPAPPSTVSSGPNGSPQPPEPEPPVPLCPLPEIFNASPPVHPPSDHPSVSESIAFLTPRDRQDRRTGRFPRTELAKVSDQFSQPSPHRHQKPKQKPNQRPTKTGNPILDQLLETLRQPPLAHPQHIPQPTAHDSS